MFLCCILFFQLFNFTSIAHHLHHCAPDAPHSLFVNSDSFDKCHQHKSRVMMRARERVCSLTPLHMNQRQSHCLNLPYLPTSSSCCLVPTIIEGSFALCVEKRHWKLTCDAI